MLVRFTGAVRRLESSEYDYPEPRSVGRLATSYVDTRTASLKPKLRKRLIGVEVAMPLFSGWMGR